MQDQDHLEEEAETKPNPPQLYQQEEIRISSSGSSPNIEDTKISKSTSNQFDLFDQFVASKEEKPIIKTVSEPPPEKLPNPPQRKEEDEPIDKVKQDHSIIEQVEKQWIIKNAEMQRIGGTYDFFNMHLERYKKHLLARKIVLTNVTSAIDKNKVTRAHPIIILKEYFKDYSSLCVDFHERSYKYEIPQREQTDNKFANIRVQLRTGFDRLFAVRKQTGNQMSRLQKFMKATTLTKIDKAIQVYWGVVASHQAKSTAKRDHFQEKEKKFQKRIEKISKVYGKGRIGNEIDEDVFEEMVKFVKEERELRYSIYDWGKEILNLRKNIMNADYGFFTQLQAALAEFKNFNDTVYQLQKKKFNFLQRLKDNIEANYLFEKLVSPLDNDYIISVLNFKNKAAVSLLKQEDYEYFLNEEYFGEIIGQTTQFLKGTIIKSFPLKNPDEDLVKTVSGNLVHYNKKSLEVKFKAKIANTTATFEGHGCVMLKEIVKGIIFDSQNIHKVSFRDDNRAEEIVLFLSGQLDPQ